ncbi:MAG: trypsin-like peptidase domain-containing protein [Candidatus Howiella sp.]|jgi:serine protease Do
MNEFDEKNLPQEPEVPVTAPDTPTRSERDSSAQPPVSTRDADGIQAPPAPEESALEQATWNTDPVGTPAPEKPDDSLCPAQEAPQPASYTPEPSVSPQPGYHFDPMTGRPVGQGTPPAAPIPGLHSYAQNPSGAIVFSDPEPGKSERTKTSGFKVFMIALSAVLVLAIVAGSFYFIGRGNAGTGSNGGSVGGSYVSPDLADRPSGDVEEGTAAYVYNQVVGSVVLIEVYSYDDPSSGSQASGVVYSEDGYIITNDHIYEDISNPQFLITFSDGRRMDAQFVAGDQRTDLAVLKVEASGLPAATFGDSSQAMIGDDIITIGNPGGSDCAFSLTEGVISAVDRWASNSSNYSMKFIQIDAAINSGSSGGALVNLHGQVIGITSWKYVGTSYENMAFAIPTTTVRRVCDSLIANGYVADRAKLGIKYQTVTAVSAKLNNLSNTGLLVAEVTSGTPIEKAGVAVGDLITHINGTAITDSSVMLEILENMSPGDQAVLTVLKSSGATADITVGLIEDRGSSSYNTKSSEGSASSGGGGEFNFPDGD